MQRKGDSGRGTEREKDVGCLHQSSLYLSVPLICLVGYRFFHSDFIITAIAHYLPSRQKEREREMN